MTLTKSRTSESTGACRRLNASFNTAFGPTGNVIVGLATGNLTAQMEAQLTSDVGKVVNSPIISTINNQMAYIEISRINSLLDKHVDGGRHGHNVVQQSTPQFITVDRLT